MFCPICKSEYREGFTTCSDCHVPLVEAIPVWDSPEAFEVLWTGESATFQTRLLEELERAQIGAAGIPLDVLFRNSRDVLRMLPVPRFGVCVQNVDAPAARQILEKLLNEEPEDAALDADAIPFSTKESEAIPELPANWDSSSASVEVWSGTEKNHLEFVEASLHGIGIPTLRKTEDARTFHILVRPEDKVRAGEIVRQIETNTIPQEDLVSQPDYIWLDEPVKSYQLLWLIAGLDLLALILHAYTQSESLLDSIPDLLTSLGGFIANIGELWMLYQAIRYEMRPVRFILLAIFIPFSFLWYYTERYSTRTGVRRLPVAMRMRMSPPTSA